MAKCLWVWVCAKTQNNSNHQNIHIPSQKADLIYTVYETTAVSMPPVFGDKHIRESHANMLEHGFSVNTFEWCMTVKELYLGKSMHCNFIF